MLAKACGRDSLRSYVQYGAEPVARNVYGGICIGDMRQYLRWQARAAFDRKVPFIPKHSPSVVVGFCLHDHGLVLHHGPAIEHDEQ